MQNTRANDNKNSLTITLFTAILLFATLPHVSADMYVPSLPAITKRLMTTPAAAQLTLSAFMFGFSISHLIYGPLSDRVGRRSPLLFGIGLSFLGTCLCLFATNIDILIAGRLIQGIGVASCNSAGRSLSRDLFSGPQLAKIGSHLGMVMILVTATAPTLGGYIQYYFNWRSVFLVLLAYTVFVWWFAYRFLPETNIYLNREATQVKVMLKNYWTLLTSSTFMGYTLCVSLAYAGIFAYVSSAPFLLQNIVGLTAVEYGWLAFVIGAGVFISFFTNSRLVMTVGIKKLVLTGIIFMLAGGSSMLIFAWLGWLNVFVIMLPVALFCTGAGFSFANASAGAFHPFPHIAGAASALFGCLQIFGGAAASAFMATVHIKNQIPLGSVLLSLGILSFLSWKFLATRQMKIHSSEN